MKSLAVSTLVLLLLGNSSWAHGRSLWPCMGGSGSGMPSPFAPNSKVELASGENYVLIGTLVQLDSGNYGLQIDLTQMPWLGSVERKANPVYPLITSGDNSQHAAMSGWVGMHVMANGRAIGQIQTDANDNPQYVLSLRLEKGGVEPVENLLCVTDR